MQTFEIDLFDGHLIFESDGKKVMVDTGSPVTLSDQDKIAFMGEEHDSVTSVGGHSISDISNLLGYHLDVLMGLDILQEYYILMDYANRKITFSKEVIPFESVASLPISRGMMGTMCLHLTVKGNDVLMAFDTGAKISYIEQRFTSDEAELEVRDDFHPGVGHFQTPVYAMEVSAGGSSFPVLFGTLPPILAMPLQLFGVSGVIGYDLMNRYNVLIDFNDNVLYLK